jgi:hypothetical protein
MPGALELAGAAREPSTFAPLHTDRIFTGFWPNRNVLRDGATTEYQLRYGLGRQDSILSGYNVEVSPFLTLIRRPGHGLYNGNAFAAIKSFYSYHTFSLTDEAIRVLADTGTQILDVTNGGLSNVMTKGAGAGRAYFLTVGNTLYITDGVENKQIVQASKSWLANTRYFVGDRVVANGYVWEVKGFQWAGTSTYSVYATQSGIVADITLGAPVTFPLTEPSMLFGTVVPQFNEIPYPVIWQSTSSFQMQSIGDGVGLSYGSKPLGGYVASTRSSGGVSGGSLPFTTPTNLWAGDGEILWKNMGPSVSDWGMVQPQTAPTVTQAAAATPFVPWAPNQCFSRNEPIFPFILTDSNGNIQNCTTFGTTGTVVPTWDTRVNYSTPDGTCMWQNYGSGVWQPNTNYGGSSIVTVLATGPGGGQGNYYFLCVQAGQSAASQPAVWSDAIGAFVSDGSVIWKNIGPFTDWSSSIGPSTKIIQASTIVDANGYLQAVVIPGKTGPQPPIWNVTVGGKTQELANTQNGTVNGVQWQNMGPFSAGTTAAIRYGYAYKRASTQDVTNMSPASVSIIVTAGKQVVVSGANEPNPQPGDTIVIYRTLQGGGTFYYLAEVPATAYGAVWTYNDTQQSDNALTQDIQAVVDGSGTPFPIGGGPMAYHVGRIFYAVGNVVYVSSGPDMAVARSSGNASYDQAFTMQSKVVRFWVTSLGLVVFTGRDSYIFLGDGTDSNPLTPVIFITNLPLLSYDCMCEYMTSAFLYLGTRMVVQLNPGSGVNEVSFQVANYLLNTGNGYDPKTSYLTFNTEGSNETALYLSNGVSEYLRMALSTTPESGSNWNPPAIIPQGMSAVQSVETSPGQFHLLCGPRAGSNGNILYRSRAANTDNGTLYSASAVFGSIAMADPGQLAGLAWMTLTSQITGTAPELSVLIGEISGEFEIVERTRQDPPDLPPANSIRSDRHHFLQGQDPVWCRHFQFAIDWPAEAAFNELLSFTIFGQQIQEMRGS